MRYCLPRISWLVPLFALLVGCTSTPQHTNVMVFGTNTKLGLDASVNAAGGTPDFTFGYKRQEIVWMPLLANELYEESPPKPAKCGDSCMYIGRDETRTDTYSVLASFGAKFGGSANATGSQGGSASGNGGLAQFFVTGLAARNLANSGGARLVSVQGADAESLSIARDAIAYRAAEAERIETRLIAELGEDQYNAIASGTAAQRKTLKSKVDEIIQHVSTEDGDLDESVWDALVTKAEGTPDFLSDIDNVDNLKRYLDGQIASADDEIINALHSAIGAASDD